jgi:mannosyl-oligosaccharide glucosidase
MPDRDSLLWKWAHRGSEYRGLWPVAGPRVAHRPSSVGKPAQPSMQSASWGTYRPGLYFGMRQTVPKSTLMGLMWTHPQDNDALEAIRHEARQDHGLDKWGWELHDGVSYGKQTIWDRDLSLEIQWARDISADALGGQPGKETSSDWSVQVKVSSLNGSRRTAGSLFFYFGEENIERGVDVAEATGGKDIGCSFWSRAAGWCASLATSGVYVKRNHMTVKTPHFHNLTDRVADALYFSLMQQHQMGATQGYALELPDMKEADSNVGFQQISGLLPFSVDLKLRYVDDTERDNLPDYPQVGESSDDLFREREDAFENKFNATFPDLLQDPSHYRVSKYALSNMMGGIGYWHGRSLVDTGSEVMELWKAPLLSAVPSRSFFPRGFLWDEGFHNLLIRKWNPAISRSIIAHWLDLMTDSGWIPREQILGEEARSRVPDEFVPQHPSAANPPTLFLVLSRMATEGLDEDMEFLNLAWPRLDKWFRWYNSTQAGLITGSYRWRGRDELSKTELNPKTLTSGLDDYPRASHPSADERHLDLRCWMAVAARTMSTVEDLVLPPGRKREYGDLADMLEDYDSLKRLHWDSKSKVFSDFGLDSPDLQLVNGHRMPVVGGVAPKLGFVSQHQGYVTMFPLALKLIPADAPELSSVLDVLESPEHLWSPYGLRSLAASSPIYDKWNTLHDPPYWRGAVWININYLILDALQTKYSENPRAQKIAKSLRHNLVGTISEQFEKRNFVFENYDDKSGTGKGCYPFTGWTSLVALM